MRTALLILGTATIIVAVAALYVMLQPAVALPTAAGPTTLKSAVRPPEQTETSSASGVKSGEEGVFKVFDEKTGALAKIFRVGKYEPKADGSIDVDHPQAEFYFDNGQILVIDGTHGRMILPGAAGKTGDFRGSVGPPSRGDLHDVTLTLFQNNDRGTPVLVAEVNNVSFDNDTLRIATEAYTDADGKIVPADQVPVNLRGQQYDFAGRGLTVRWNDKDKRMESMEIAHGESLTLKSGQLLGAPMSPAPAPKPAAPVAVGPRTTPPPAERPVRAAARRGAPDSARGPKSNETIYHSTFEGPVTVTQGDVQVALAKTMYVDFKPEQNESATPAKTAGAAATQPATRSAREPREAREPRQPAPLAQAPAPVLPATQPSTQPAEPPIVIHWPGKLTIVPLDDPSKVKLKPGSMQIEMVSTDEPVVLNRDGREIKCTSFVYNNSDDSLSVRSSPLFPAIAMTDGNGSNFFTPKLDYNGTTKRAILEGPSHAEIPITDEKTGKIEMLTASWTKQCVLTLTGASRDEMSIQLAQMYGDVSYDHPNMKLHAQQTDISFGPPTKNPTSGKTISGPIEKLQALGAVACDMTDQQGKAQHITADKLGLTMSKTDGGRMVPRWLETDGNVHTFDDEHELYASHMDVTMLPTTRPGDAPQIEWLRALDNVRFASGDAKGQADLLEATANGDDFDTRLSGSNASVSNGDSTISGAIINIRPKRQYMEVAGPGTLHGVARRNPDEKPTPFDMKWSKGLSIDGQTNHGEINGDVAVTTISSTDNSTVNVTGNQVRLELMDDPNAKPAATQPATAPAPGTDIASAFGGMHNKVLKTIRIDGDDAHVQSVLPAPDGTPMREMNLYAPTIVMNQETRNVIIPTKGMMLYVDRRPTTRPSTQQANAAGADDNSMNGSTGFFWDKQLVYGDADGKAEIEGNVQVVHQDNAGVEKFRILAPCMAAVLDKADKSTTQPSDVKLKQLSASGSSSEDAEFHVPQQVDIFGHDMTFDPQTAIVKVVGSDVSPVRITGNKAAFRGALDQVFWNTKTQEWDMSGGKMGGGR